MGNVVVKEVLHSKKYLKFFQQLILQSCYELNFKRMTFKSWACLHTPALLTSAEWKQVLMHHILCLEENNGWNAARRCNKSKLIHHGCPRRALDRGPCREAADLSTVRVDTFPAASLAAPSCHLTSSWRRRSGRQEEESFYRTAYVTNVWADLLEWFNFAHAGVFVCVAGGEQCETWRTGSTLKIWSKLWRPHECYKTGPTHASFCVIVSCFMSQMQRGC